MDVDTVSPHNETIQQSGLKKKKKAEVIYYLSVMNLSVLVHELHKY